MVVSLLSDKCSHLKAPAYFTESINNKEKFVSTECESFESYAAGACSNNKNITLGGDLRLEDRGNYYLFTKAEKPYFVE